MAHQLIVSHLQFLRGKYLSVFGGLIFGIGLGGIGVIVAGINPQFNLSALYNDWFGGATQRTAIVSLLVVGAFVPLLPILVHVVKFIYDCLIGGLTFVFGFWLSLIFGLLVMEPISDDLRQTIWAGFGSFASIVAAILLFGPLTLEEFRAFALAKGRMQAVKNWWYLYAAWFVFAIGMAIWAFWTVGWST